MSDTQQERYLVTGATGAQGGAVLKLLSERGREVVGLARHTATPHDGAIVRTVDLADREGLCRAFEGVTRVAAGLPLVYDMEMASAYAANLVHAAERAGVRRLVLNTNLPVPSKPTGYPAFETRRIAEETLRSSGLPITVLRPPLYLDNLFGPGHAPALVNDGVLAFPLPNSLPVSWMSLDDMAAATVAALDGADELVGSALPVGGPEAVTGPRLAELFARELGREVTFHAMAPGDFEAAVGAIMGPELGAGIAGGYHWAWASAGEDAFTADPVAVEKHLGIRLTPLRRWIAAQPWSRWARPAD
ncbi:SDR family oxidoreductase [Streptomyces huiliensis]|uniref:SDR family oxidoreductase n=1 Tax=Streptomyces huiliensis TaxID=2876027 RepID=UPI001CC07A1C|nr:NmrA family NAD(P)-binding protein [Streptomyces huiliensis]MBZ4317858.1 NmrA family NAD(P)-binding protein [Streptomyces huiliensis]